MFMMKGVMMTAIVSVANRPGSEQSEPKASASEDSSENGSQVVKSLVAAGKQSYSSPYTVTIKKVEPIPGGSQVRVTLFITGDDEPAHDFTETGKQVVTAFLDAGMHTNVAGAGSAKVESIEALEGGDDDSDDDSDESADALSGVLPKATLTPPTPPASAPAPQPSAATTPAGSPSASAASPPAKHAADKAPDEAPDSNSAVDAPPNAPNDDDMTSGDTRLRRE
jgi:hypothetical protein